MSILVLSEYHNIFILKSKEKVSNNNHVIL